MFIILILIQTGTIMKNLLSFAVFIFLLINCNTVAQETKPEITITAGNSVIAALVADDAPEDIYKLMNSAKNTVVEGDLRKALETYINPIVEYFEKEYKVKYTHMYSPRTQQESMLYTFEGLSISEVKSSEVKQKNIYRIPFIFAEAYYLKGSLHISLGKLDLGKMALEHAVELAPHNSLFLSELGYTYQAEGKFLEAIGIYEKAMDSANFSPDTEKDKEKRRAIRGIGYSLIELNRLDEAEEKYQQALEIDPKDAKALNELKYIKGLRNK